MQAERVGEWLTSLFLLFFSQLCLQTALWCGKLKERVCQYLPPSLHRSCTLIHFPSFHLFLSPPFFLYGWPNKTRMWPCNHITSTHPVCVCVWECMRKWENECLCVNRALCMHKCEWGWVMFHTVISFMKNAIYDFSIWNQHEYKEYIFNSNVAWKKIKIFFIMDILWTWSLFDLWLIKSAKKMEDFEWDLNLTLKLNPSACMHCTVP